MSWASIKAFDPNDYIFFVKEIIFLASDTKKIKQIYVNWIQNWAKIQRGFLFYGEQIKKNWIQKFKIDFIAEFYNVFQRTHIEK